MLRWTHNLLAIVESGKNLPEVSIHWGRESRGTVLRVLPYSRPLAILSNSLLLSSNKVSCLWHTPAGLIVHSTLAPKQRAPLNIE